MEAKIFLAAERGHTEYESFRSYHTFNFGTYQNKHKKPFGPLTVLNDETLAGGRQVALTFIEDTLLVLLPIVGGIAVQHLNGEEAFLQPGEIHLFTHQKGGTTHVRNPYDTDLVNYVQLRFCYPPHNSLNSNIGFQLDDNQNSFVHLFSTLQAHGFYLKAVIGKFKGRNEGMYAISSVENSVLLFVIEGAFEAENRLLESRDALALWKAERVEVEALSESAILLVIEMGPDK